MSSHVFYKFKAQKESSKILFDGPSISVWELKKEIIRASKMGKGTDFDFAIYNIDTEEEYTNDNASIPRATGVLARRLPPRRPGHGNAAKYMVDEDKVSSTSAVAGSSGGQGQIYRGPTSVRFNQKEDMNKAKKESTPTPTPIPSAGGEDEAARVAQMFQESNAQWEDTQQKMATAQKVGYGGRGRGGGPGFHGRGGGPNAPDKPVPRGYICYRCGKPDHWIYNCPNTDDDSGPRKRITRSTGIPRSFLKSVEEGDAAGTGNVMVTADGSFVMATPDSESWNKHRAITKNANAVDPDELEPTDPDLICPMCSRLLRDPVKTPCCSTVFCEECIQNYLLDNDFVCPECESKIKSLDLLVKDEERRKRVREFKEQVMKKKKELAQAAEKEAGEGVKEEEGEKAASDKGKEKEKETAKEGGIKESTPMVVVASTDTQEEEGAIAEDKPKDVSSLPPKPVTGNAVKSPNPQSRSNSRQPSQPPHQQQRNGPPPIRLNPNMSMGMPFNGMMNGMNVNNGQPMSMGMGMVNVPAMSMMGNPGAGMGRMGGGGHGGMGHMQGGGGGGMVNPMVLQQQLMQTQAALSNPNISNQMRMQLQVQLGQLRNMAMSMGMMSGGGGGMAMGGMGMGGGMGYGGMGMMGGDGDGGFGMGGHGGGGNPMMMMMAQQQQQHQGGWNMPFPNQQPPPTDSPYMRIPVNYGGVKGNHNTAAGRAGAANAGAKRGRPADFVELGGGDAERAAQVAKMGD